MKNILALLLLCSVAYSQNEHVSNPLRMATVDLSTVTDSVKLFDLRAGETMLGMWIAVDTTITGEAATVNIGISGAAANDKFLSAGVESLPLGYRGMLNHFAQSGNFPITEYSHLAPYVAIKNESVYLYTTADSGRLRVYMSTLPE